MNCPRCNDTSTKFGLKSTKDGSNQRYKCHSCKYVFTDNSIAIYQSTQEYTSQEYYKLMLRATSLGMNLPEYIKWHLFHTH